MYKNWKIIIPDKSLVTSSLDSISIKPNKIILTEIDLIKEDVGKKIKQSNFIEVETISVDWFKDFFVNNPNIEKDLDDWFIVEKTGYWYLLKVNISSPSNSINLNSEIFKNIILQTTSIYYKSHVNPMMPFELSNDLFSLIFNKIRLWLTVEVEIDNNWNVLDYKIFQSKIKNILMSNHSEFNRILNNNSNSNLNKFNEVVKNITDLWKILRNKRSINTDFSWSVESQRKIGYDKNDSYAIWYVSDIVEEIMILANSLASDFMLQNPKIVWIFRNHMPEYKDKIFYWEQMDRANYDIIMRYHFWLLMEKYTHFTSPIRRAPDLLTHYWINAFLEWKNQVFEKENMSQYLWEYLNSRQEILITRTNKYNKEVEIKQKNRQEKKRLSDDRKKYIEKLEFSYNNYDISWEKLAELNEEDFINTLKYFCIKNKKIDIFFITQIKYRFNTNRLIYNKIMPILLLSWNYNLQKLFIEYQEKLNSYNYLLKFLRTEWNINNKYIFNEFRKTEKNKEKKDITTFHRFFINDRDWNIQIMSDSKVSKKEVSFDFMNEIIHSGINFL